MVNTVIDFLSKKECKKLIKIINENNRKSEVVNNDGIGAKYDESSRTSSTSDLVPNDPLIKKITKRIAKHLGYNSNQAEGLQGQLYAPGEFFRPHYDWFSEGDSYNRNCLNSGQRIHTMMVYLNEPKKGGKTKFPNLDLKIKPAKGMAVDWPNVVDGKENEKVLHEGSDVKKGKKYIITSWWRENEVNQHEDNRLYQELVEESAKPKPKTTKKLTTKSTKKTVKKSTKKVKTPLKTSSNGITQFTHADELPRLTKLGFTVVKAPTEAWNLINEIYELLKPTLTEEIFEGKENIITTPYHNVHNTSDLMDLSYVPTIREILHKGLQPLHEEFIKNKEPLVPSAVYGIRSYNRGAVLETHTDRIATHHVSSILIVDKNIECEECGSKKKKKKKKIIKDWALDIQDHDGNWHKVYAEPGDMILYESAICAHGRNERLLGEFYRNFYVHYKLENWEYVGDEQ